MESVKNSITGLFKSKTENTPSDHISISISQVNSISKQKEVICEGHGSWLGQIYIDSKKYISNNYNFKIDYGLSKILLKIGLKITYFYYLLIVIKDLI